MRCSEKATLLVASKCSVLFCFVLVCFFFAPKGNAMSGAIRYCICLSLPYEGFFLPLPWGLYG